jgi:hypothetical protein
MFDLAAGVSVDATEEYGCSNKDQYERPEDVREHWNELSRKEDETDHDDEQAYENTTPVGRHTETHFLLTASSSLLDAHNRFSTLRASYSIIRVLGAAVDAVDHIPHLIHTMSATEAITSYEQIQVACK